MSTAAGECDMIPNRTTRKAAVVKPDLRPVRKSLKLTQPELKTFADFFYRHTGISFSESKYGLLQTQKFRECEAGVGGTIGLQVDLAELPHCPQAFRMVAPSTHFHTSPKR